LAYIHSTNTSTHESTNKFYTKVFSNKVSYYLVFPLTLIATFGVVYYVNVSALSANRTLIQAMTSQKGGVEKNLELFKKVYSYNSFGSTEATEQLVQTATQVRSLELADATKKAFYDLAKSKVIEKVESVPNDARYLVFTGSFFNRFGEIDEAIKYLELALKESPNKQSIYIELGSSYINKGNTTKALELFKKAYDLKPTIKESQIVYAIGAIYSKNVAVLNELSKLIDNEAVISDDRILKAYADVGDYNNVINILNLRLEKDPKNTQNRLTLAGAYMTIGQKQKAIDIIREIIKSDPSFKDKGEEYIRQIQNS